MQKITKSMFGNHARPNAPTQKSNTKCRSRARQAERKLHEEPQHKLELVSDEAHIKCIIFPCIFHSPNLLFRQKVTVVRGTGSFTIRFARSVTPHACHRREVGALSSRLAYAAGLLCMVFVSMFIFFSKKNLERPTAALCSEASGARPFQWKKVHPTSASSRDRPKDHGASALGP